MEWSSIYVSDDEDEPPTKNNYIRYQLFPRHLDKAINPDKIHFFFKNPSAWDQSRHPIATSSFIDLSTGIYNGTNIMQWIYNKLIDTSTINDILARYKFEKITDSALSSIDIQTNALFNSLSKFEKHQVSKFQKVLKTDQDLFLLFKRKLQIMQLHFNLEEASKDVAKDPLVPNFEWLQIYDDCFLLRGFPTNDILIPYTILLSVADKIESEFSFQMYIKLASLSPDRSEMDTVNLSVQIYKILDKVHNILSNNSADIYKSLEALIVGWILEFLGPNDGYVTLASQTMGELIEKHPVCHNTLADLKDLVMNYLLKFGNHGIPLILEQFGQEKLHYYPVVDTESGLIKMYRYGTAYREVVDVEVEEVLGEIKKEYIAAYQAEHHVLPPIKQLSNYHPLITKIFGYNSVTTLRELSKVHNIEWSRVQFYPHQSFTYYPDPLELLDDKTISPYRSALEQIYTQDVKKFFKIPRTNLTQNTRLVLEMISRENTSIKTFFDKVKELNGIPFEWAIILLMEKELELKIEARDFSILTYECRMMAATCERNLSATIFKYFPQQSMSDSGPSLKQRIMRYARMLSGPEGGTIAIHLDLEQWNYTFRLPLVGPFINFFNSIFGVDCYTILKYLFTDALLVSASKYHPIGRTNRFSAWTHHIGGNQGICQKFWTLITIARIRSSMQKFSYKYELIGSGDNQVLLVHIDKNQNKSEAAHQIIERLRVDFKRIGLGLKDSESWYSTSLLCYQRKYYFRGYPCPAGLKQSVKAYVGGTDINAGLNLQIMTAMNGGMSISENVSNPIIGPLYSYIEALTAILGSPRVPEANDWSNNILIALTLATGEFGLFPFLQLTNFTSAGHKDLITECLSMLRLLWDKNLFDKQCIKNILALEPSELTPNVLLQLALNPQSLNVKKPVSPEALIKNEVEKFLLTSEKIRNTKLREMFKLLNPEIQQTYSKQLFQFRPIHLSVIHTLFESSCIGQSLHTLNRFNRIASIVRLVNVQKDPREVVSFRTRIFDLDRQAVRFVTQRFNKHVLIITNFFESTLGGYYSRYVEFCTKHNLAILCTFSMRLYLVSETYGLYPELCYGPFTPAPSEQLKFLESYSADDITSSIVISPQYHIPATLEGIEQTIGPHPYYIGSKTMDPVKTLKLVNLEGLDAGRAIKNFLKIHAWMQSSSSDERIIKFLEDQICIRAPLLRNILPYIFSGTAGGTLIHRYETLGVVMGCYNNSRSNISTHYYISTNSATDLQRGEVDRYIFFQALFQHIFTALRFCLPYQNKLIAKVLTDHCGYVAPDLKFSLTDIGLPTDLSVTDGLIINDEVLDLLKIEANFQERILKLNTTQAFTAQECICSYLAFELAKDLILHNNRGYSALNDSDMFASGQGRYNVTLFRFVDIPLLLKSLGFSLILNGAFRCGFSKVKLIQMLRLRSQHTYSLSHYGPFKGFLEALSVAGRVPDLVTYTKIPYIWTKSRLHKQLLHILFAGIHYALTDRSLFNIRIPALIEARSSSYNFGNAYRVFRGWNARLRRVGPTSLSTCDPDEFIGEISSVPEIKLTIVTTRDEVLERGRKLMKFESTQGTSLPIQGTYCTSAYWTIISKLNPWGVVEIVRDNHLLEINPIHVSNIPTDCWRFRIPKWYSKIGKWLYASSSSYLKMIELINALHIETEPFTTIISLADGSGAQLGTLMHIFHQAVGIFNTLYQAEFLPNFQGIAITPPSLMCTCGLLNRLITRNKVWQAHGDLCRKITWDELESELDSARDTKCLLTWDMESREVEADVAWGYLNTFIEHFPPFALILKLYIPITSTFISACLDRIKHTYSNVKLIKPSYSPLWTDEIYLVASTPRSLMMPFTQNHSRSAIKYSAYMDIALNEVSEVYWHRQLYEQLQITWNLRPCVFESPLTHKFIISLEQDIDLYLAQILDTFLNYGVSRGASDFLQEPSLNHMTLGNTAGAQSFYFETFISLLSLFLMLKSTNCLMQSSDAMREAFVPEEGFPYLLLQIITNHQELLEKERSTLLMRKIGYWFNAWVLGLSNLFYIKLYWIIHLLVDTNTEPLLEGFSAITLDYIPIRLADDVVPLHIRESVLWLGPSELHAIQSWFLRHFHFSDIHTRHYLVQPGSAEQLLDLLIGRPTIDNKTKRRSLVVNLTKQQSCPCEYEPARIYIFFSQNPRVAPPRWADSFIQSRLPLTYPSLYIVRCITNTIASRDMEISLEWSLLNAN